MAWRLLKVNELPIGNRVLRYGCQGSDVLELQKLLAQGGFYFGTIDGLYGVLTEEAVVRAEKMFKLRVDGIAGRQVVNALLRLGRKAGRIVYTVKKYDSLESISQKFGVAPNAWEGVVGQGNPWKKLFSGMKLMLYEKAILAWGAVNPSSASVFSGILNSQVRIDETGHLEDIPVAANGDFLILTFTDPIWEKLNTSPHSQKQLISDLRRLQGFKFGLDLRNLSFGLLDFRKKLLRNILKGINRNQFDFILLSIDPGDHGLKKRPDIGIRDLNMFGKWLLVDCQTGAGSYDVEARLTAYWQILPKINRYAMNRIFPVVGTNGWEWSVKGERRVLYREAKILRALHYRTSQYLPALFCTRVNYLLQGNEYQLFYRDYQGWMDYFGYLKRYHFPGTVICEPAAMGNAFAELIPNAFAVMPGSKLNELL